MQKVQRLVKRAPKDSSENAKAFDVKNEFDKDWFKTKSSCGKCGNSKCSCARNKKTKTKLLQIQFSIPQ